MHFVEHLEAVAEMKMIRSVDDLEFGVGSEAIAEWPDAGVEVDEDIVAGGEYEAGYLLVQWEFSGIERLSSHERFGCGCKAANGSNPRVESGDLQSGPSAERMTRQFAWGLRTVGRSS